MSIKANPVTGKELFELVSLAVSAVNGCSLCVTLHEDALVKQGTDRQRIHDAVRLAAVSALLMIIDGDTLRLSILQWLPYLYLHSATFAIYRRWH